MNLLDVILIAAGLMIVIGAGIAIWRRNRKAYRPSGGVPSDRMTPLPRPSAAAQPAEKEEDTLIGGGSAIDWSNLDQYRPGAAPKTDVPPPAPAAPPAPMPQAPARVEMLDADILPEPVDAGDIPDWLSADDADEADPALTAVNFTAYYPREVTPDQRYSLIVYAFAEMFKAAIARDVEKFAEELGGDVPRPRPAKQIAQLAAGTAVTVTLESDEIAFDPPSLTKTWHGDWTRFEFEFRPSASQVDETLSVRVSVQVAGIEIAHINCALEVIPPQVAPAPVNVALAASNPLMHAKLNSQTATRYERIFISYSRKDSAIARAYKLAQTALGNEVFLDVDNLRAGENWQAKLAEAIDQADIFQLFWSEHSAGSEYCAYEWDYALKFRCPENQCTSFIRPVYWRKPMPAPPTALGHLNFRYVEFEE